MPLEEERTADDTPARRSRERLDPLTKRLVALSGILVVAVLVTTGAIVYYASAGSKVPRTAVERDAIVARQQVQKTPKDANAWVALATADIKAEKYDEADAAIKGLSQLTNRAIVLLLKGDLAAAKGDISGARGYYTQGAAQAKKDHESDVASAAAGGVAAQSVDASQPEAEAYLALGRLDLQVKDYPAAVKHLQASVSLEPNAADTLTLLGTAQAAAGEQVAARASFKKALQFIPDYQPALDGLKQLDGGR